MRQTATRKVRNQHTKRDLRTAIKAFIGKESNETVSKTQSELDKAVKKGIMSKNTAARKKAQIAKQAKAAGVKVGAAAPVKKAAAPKAKAAKAAKPAAAKKPAVAKKPVAKKAAPKKTEK